MDDVVKRREARRRKILENTQNRLNRIIGIEQKTIRAPTCEIHTDKEVEYPSSNTVTEPNAIEQQPPVVTQQQVPQQQQEQPVQKQYRSTVISGLAVFINILLLILDKFLKFDSNSSHINKIFLPLLVYEVTEFMALSKHRTENKSFIYLLIIANAKNNHIVNIIKHLEIITSILHDVMIYFFAYVCCDFVKYLMWTLS
jgi:hypothetical protein